MKNRDEASANVSGRRSAGPAQGIIVVAAMFLPTLAFLSLPATLPKLLLHFSGDPLAGSLVPIIVTAPALCMALLSPVAGSIADRFGRRPVMFSAIAIFTICGMLPLVLDDLRLIVASRFGLGIGNAALLTLGATLIGDYFGDSERQRWLTINGIAGAALGTLAIAAGGWLAETDWRGPFALYGLGVPLFLFALVALWEPQRPSVDESDASQSFQWRALVWTAAAVAAIAVIFFVQPVQIGLLLAGAGLTSTSAIGLVSALASIGVPLGSLLFGYLASRAVSVLLALGLALNALGLVGIGLSHAPWAVGVASFVQQIGNGVLLPTSIYWMQSQAPFAVRARAMGLWTTAFFAGQFVSPWVVSFGTTVLGSLQRSVLACGIAAFTMIIVSLLGRRLLGRRHRDAITADSAPLQQR